MKSLIGIVCLGIVLATGCAATPTNQNNEPVGRTLPEHVNDLSIENQISSNIQNAIGIHPQSYRVAVNSFQGDVLLTGEVPNNEIKQRIAQLASTVPNVRGVYDRLIISEPKSQSHSAHEAYLKTKVVAKILAQRSINPTQYELVVRNDIVYVLGTLTATQYESLQHAVKDTDGILGFSSLATILTQNASEYNQYRPNTGMQNPYSATIANNQNPYPPNNTTNTYNTLNYPNPNQNSNVPTPYNTNPYQNGYVQNNANQAPNYQNTYYSNHSNGYNTNTYNSTYNNGATYNLTNQNPNQNSNAPTPYNTNPYQNGYAQNNANQPNPYTPNYQNPYNFNNSGNPNAYINNTNYNNAMSVNTPNSDYVRLYSGTGMP